MSRYKLSDCKDELQVTLIDDGALPLRAISFLRFARKTHKNADLYLEIRDGQILIWIEDKKRQSVMEES